MDDKMKDIKEQFSQFLKRNKLNFEESEEHFILQWTSEENKDLDSTCMIEFDLDSKRIFVHFLFAFTIDDSYLLETAIAVCMVNNCLYEGNFEIIFENNSVIFRNCYRYKEQVDDDLFKTVTYNGLKTYDPFVLKIKEVSNGECGIKELDDFLNAPTKD